MCQWARYKTFIFKYINLAQYTHNKLETGSLYDDRTIILDRVTNIFKTSLCIFVRWKQKYDACVAEFLSSFCLFPFPRNNETISCATFWYSAYQLPTTVHYLVTIVCLPKSDITQSASTFQNRYSGIRTTNEQNVILLITSRTRNMT